MKDDNKVYKANYNFIRKSECNDFIRDPWKTDFARDTFNSLEPNNDVVAVYKIILWRLSVLSSMWQIIPWIFHWFHVLFMRFNDDSIFVGESFSIYAIHKCTRVHVNTYDCANSWKLFSSKGKRKKYEYSTLV